MVGTTEAASTGAAATTGAAGAPAALRHVNVSSRPRLVGGGFPLHSGVGTTALLDPIVPIVDPTRFTGTPGAGGTVCPLDEFFALRDWDSEWAITEHATDTAGFTDQLFGAYDNAQPSPVSALADPIAHARAQ